MDYVTSSNIDAMTYLKLDKTLRINFKNGSVYEWKGISSKKYDAMLEAESKGKYFAKNIKGQYPSKKIKDADKKFNGDLKDFFNI